MSTIPPELSVMRTRGCEEVEYSSDGRHAIACEAEAADRRSGDMREQQA